MWTHCTRSTAALLSFALIACTDAGDPSAVDLRDHSWNGYHWARTGDPFTLQVLMSVTDDWKPRLGEAVQDWSKSSVLDLSAVASSADLKVRKPCSAPRGAIRVCNAHYGFNGWLGLAGISLDAAGHIVGGYMKLNDSYFDTAYYDHDEWRQTVICQELGHDLGLDHQDEDFNNTSLKTCMDYQDPPWPTPNAHDYDELKLIYDHIDDYSTVGGGGDCKGKTCNGADAGWGELVREGPHHELWLRPAPDGGKELTFVRLAD